MKKKIKSPWFWLAVALVLCFVSMIGTSCMQTNWGKTDVKVHNVTLSELAQTIRENNEKNGKDVEITFSEDKVYNFSFMTLIPSTATADNPAPAIICCHGGANTKEMQMPGYIELSRRGFVVITMDMAGHGYSDNAIHSLTQNTYGMIAAVEYAMSLDCVIEDEIGVTGHSMGNEACFYTISLMNVTGSTQRIAAWVEGAGTKFAPSMTPEYAEGLIWTASVDMYDEFDSGIFNSSKFLEGDVAPGLVRVVYPEFNESSVPEGQWFTASGPVDTPTGGKKLDAEMAFCLFNPPITHPMFHFTDTGTRITIDGFYAAFGTPTGASFIDSDSQVWQLVVVFEVLGLIGFFMLVFPLVALLSKTTLFAGVVRKRSNTQLPALKDAREWSLLIITLVVLIVFSFFSYIKLYPQGNRYLDSSVYAADSSANGIGLWSIACGLVTIAMIIIGYGIKKLLYRKSSFKVTNPFAPVALDSVSQFFLSVLFVITVVFVMFIPVYIARYVFAADFRICSFIVTAPQIDRIPLVLIKYVPMWFAFYIPNAIMNANTKYRDVPDWVTTIICAVANCLALVIFLYIQYSTFFKTGYLWNADCGMAGIVGFAVAPCLAYAAFSARYAYNKTNNAWIAGMINGTVMCCAFLFCTRISTDFIFTF